MTTKSTEVLDLGKEHVVVRRFRLRVDGGPDRGLSYEAASGRITIGTHRSADFVLNDRTMSRFHCAITNERGAVLLRDLGSRNGTLVDGVAVLEAPLQRDATLILGRTRVAFEIGRSDLKLPLAARQRFGRLVGRSAAMRAVFLQLEHAAAALAPVVIQGETGTGKDLAAEAIHSESARRSGAFVVVDCGAIAPSLLESELFGHERGAFTGAAHARAGAFEAAHGGTLFLDEIGELDLALQPKFLRALEAGEIRRLGGREPIRVDVRVIAATNRNLEVEVNAKRFRSDLYYRLAVLRIAMPPLRDRPEDIELLVRSVSGDPDAPDNTTAPLLRDPSFLAGLERHLWPGNVRELRNHVERCLALGPSAPIEDASRDPLAVDPKLPFSIARQRWMQAFERRFLEQLLRAHGNSVTQAAKAAGIGRVHFHRLMARCGLRGS